MIVVDTSAWVDMVLGRESDALADLLERDGHWVVPEHFSIEALNALRGGFLGGKVDDLGLARAVRSLADAQLDVWPTAPLIPRIVQLVRNATAYDAAYIALAEDLHCPIVASDAKLARIPGIRCRVVGYE
jgi:predicted nucleic acid-binding protein